MVRVSICFLLAMLVLLPQVLAKNSLETKVTFGEGFLGYRVRADVNLDLEGTWSADLAYSRNQFSGTDMPLTNNLYFLELNYFSDDALSLSGNFTYLDDSSGIRALGPGLALFYTYFTAPDAGSQIGSPSQMIFPTDLFTLGFDSVVLFYRASMETTINSPGITDADGHTISLTQFVPTLFADVSLIPDHLNLNGSANVFFYSDDPTQIAALISSGLTFSDLAALDSLISGFVWRGWHAGMTVTLPLVLELNGGYGRHLQVYPEEWLDDYDLSLASKVTSFLRIKLTWRRTVSSLSTGDLYSVALRLYF